MSSPSVRFESCERAEVRRKRAFVVREAQRFESTFNSFRQKREVRGCFHAAPYDARVEFIGKKSKSTEIHFDWLVQMNRGQRGA